MMNWFTGITQQIFYTLAPVNIEHYGIKTRVP